MQYKFNASLHMPHEKNRDFFSRKNNAHPMIMGQSITGRYKQCILYSLLRSAGGFFPLSPLLSEIPALFASPTPREHFSSCRVKGFFFPPFEPLCRYVNQPRGYTKPTYLRNVKREASEKFAQNT